MTEKHDEIRRKLTRHEPSQPPPDLLAKLKNQIPEHLTFATERERATVSQFRGSAWRIAASIVLLAGVGWIGLITMKSSPATFVRREIRQDRAVETFPTRVDAAADSNAVQNGPLPGAPAQPAPPQIALAAPEASKQEPERGVATLEEKKVTRQESQSFSPTVLAKPVESAEAAPKDALDRDAVTAPSVAMGSASTKSEVATNEVDDLKATGELRKESDLAARRNTRAMAAAAPPAPPVAAPAAQAAAGAAAPARPVTAKSAAIGGNSSHPVPIDCAPVVYPPEARKAKAEGIAIVAAVIGPDGKVESTELIQSLPHGLGRAAEQAVRNCRFQPAMLDGQPVRTRFEVPVRFDLEKGTCVICKSEE